MDTQPLGDPTARPFMPAENKTAGADYRVAAEEASSESAEHGENPAMGNMRAGDSGLGTPYPQADVSSMRVLSELEQNMFARDEEDELRKRLQERLASLNGGGFRVPPVLLRYGGYALLLMSAVLGLFMLGEGVSLYRSLQTLPSAVQYFTIAAGGLLVLVIFGILLRLGFAYFTLRRSPQVSLKALTLLQERVGLQVLAVEASKEAQKELIAYLQEYPLQDRAHLYRSGFSGSAIDELQLVAQRLLAREKPQSAAEWIVEFQEFFQGRLEKVARERIKKYAGKVALGTAASPVGLIDQLLVLYGALGMIRDILAIYNLRPAFAQSAVVLSRAIMQAYLSGLIGEASESGVETLSDTYEEWTGEVFAGSLSGAFKSLFAKTAEAGLNGFLLWRLGKATIRYVEMVKTKK